MIMKWSGTAGRQGFLQAIGITVYCTLVGLFMWNASSVFGKVDTFFAPIAVVMLFSVSALICGLLVFYKPYKLFLSGRKRDAIDVVVSTAAWFFVFLLIAFLIVFLQNRYMA